MSGSRDDGPRAGDVVEAPRWWRRRGAVSAGGLVVLLLAVGAALVVVPRLGGLPQDAAFRYEGRTYDQDDLLRFVRQQHALYGAEIPDLAKDGEPRRIAAQSYAVSLIVDRAVRAAGLTVSDSEVTTAEERFISRTYPSGREQFIDALAAEGLSERDVVGELRRQLLVADLYDKVTAQARVSPADVAEAFRSDPAAFAQPESRLVSEVVLPTCSAARALAPRIADAADFARIARSRSLDSTTAAKGGSLGLVVRTQLQPAFGSAAFAAKVGKVFGPIPAEGGEYCYLGLVRDVRPARSRTFDEVRSDLAAELTAQKGLAVWRSFLEKRIAGAGVEYADGFRPSDPDGVPPAVGAPGQSPTSSPSVSPGP